MLKKNEKAIKKPFKDITNQILFFKKEENPKKRIKNKEEDFEEKISKKKKLGVIKGEYLQYEDGKFSVIPGKRPNNQLEALRKVAKRLNTLFLENKNIQLTEVQQLFLQMDKKNKFNLKEEEMSLAHNVAIHRIMNAFADLLNGSSDLTTDKEDEEFLDDIWSSDDEEGKEKNKKRLKNLKNLTLSVEEKIKEVEVLIKGINKRSKNLYPGHARTNSSIGNLKDTPIIYENNEAKEVPYSVKVSESANNFLIIHNCGNYSPKTKIEENQQMIQSSSIHKNPSKSYVKLN